MDGMDVDQVVEVPDTPDRLALQNINGKNCIRREGHSSSMTNDITDEGLRDWSRKKNRYATSRGGRSMFSPPRNGSNKSEIHEDFRYTASGTGFSSRDAFFSKRNAVDSTVNHDEINYVQREYKGKEKAVSSHPQMPKSHGHGVVMHQTEHAGGSKVFQKGIRGGSQPEEHRKEMLAKSSSPSLIAEDSLSVYNNARREKIVDRCKVGATTDNGEEVEVLSGSHPRLISSHPRTSHRTGDHATTDNGEEVEVFSDLHSRFVSSRPRTSFETSGEKRLLSNGSIYPLNVAKGKQSAQKHNNSFVHYEQDDSRTIKDLAASSDDGKKIEFVTDSQSRPTSFHPQRTSSQKKLVLNGCISPLSVARAKQSSQKHNDSFAHSEQDGLGTSRESTVKDMDTRQVKGKGLLTHNLISKEPRAIIMPSSGRPPAGKVDGVSSANDDEHECAKGVSEWRTTHNNTRKLNLPLSYEGHLHSRRTDDPFNVNEPLRTRAVRRDNKDGTNAKEHLVSRESVSAVSTTQTVFPKDQGRQSYEHRGASKTVIKRQKPTSSVNHHGEPSSSAISSSELVVMGSSAEPLNVRSVRTRNSHTYRSTNPCIDIDEISPDTRNNGHHNIDGSSSGYSDVRARQLEADEILARELQEQLYNELPVVGHHEIDEHISLAMQQESSQHASSGGSHRVSHPRSSAISNLNRQSQSRSLQNPLTRRGTQARIPSTSRVTRLMGRFPGQPRTLSSRQRNSLFPPNMDVDMRIHILEALEAFNDMGMAGGFLQAQRDFNENDYEMLLALDENNHQHGGASAAQINSLPESTVQVQSDNLEDCSICLETPSIGDTIRHLPCLHRFHKNCIDEWLRRKTSCPVCKSSIT